MNILNESGSKELTLFNRYKEGQTEIFNYFFERYYQGLCVYAEKIVGSSSTAKDIVQDFFLRFWENRRKIDISVSIKSYFIRSVHNRCMDYISSRNVREMHFQRQLMLAGDEELMEYPLLNTELKDQIEKEINRLPGDIRQTFLLSRQEGLSYKQIAEQENISVKTVEFRISKALGYLRKGLDDCLYLILI